MKMQSAHRFFLGLIGATLLCFSVVAASQSTSKSTTLTAAAPLKQPRVLDILPKTYTTIGDKTVFALQLTRPFAGVPNASCDVNGVRSAVPVQVITGKARSEQLAQILKGKKSKGTPDTSDEASWLLLKCQTRFPDAAFISLRWMGEATLTQAQIDAQAEAEPIGVNTWYGQRFDYTAESVHPVAVTCMRSNANSACSPASDVNLVFTVSANSAEAMQVRLVEVTPSGKKAAVIKPLATYESEKKWLDSLSFKNLQPNTSYTVKWPAKISGLYDANLLAKTNKVKQELVVTVGDFPPLAKFSANFGIAERAGTPLVPLTIRKVDGLENLPPLKLRQLRITDEVGIIEALQTLQKVTNSDDYMSSSDYEDDYSGEPDETANTDKSNKQKPLPKYPFAWPPKNKNGEPSTVQTRELSWLKALKGTTEVAVPRTLEATAFEVVGIPLASSGLHLLEVESLSLGRELLAKNRNMYVRSGALVTDLAVHLQTSNRTQAVWVTSLSSGQAIANATVTAYDCNAKSLYTAKTNSQGWVQVNSKLQGESWNCPVYVFARLGDDLGLVKSNWQRGIESWRFENVKNIYEYSNQSMVHAALPRNLLRAGEIFHAKLYWREIANNGRLSAPNKTSNLPKVAAIVHQGSQERTEVPINWDANGNALINYKLPTGIKRGAYNISVNSMNVSSGDFRVEDFRLPVLKAEVLSPPQIQVMDWAKGKAEVEVPTRLSYLSGGVAAGEAVQISQRLFASTPKFNAYPDFDFGVSKVSRGESKEDTVTLQTLVNDQVMSENSSHKLNAQGALTVRAKLDQVFTSPQILLTEMQYRDSNGETYRALGRTQIWPASVVLGLKADYWASGKKREVELLTLDTAGKPLANIEVSVMGNFYGDVWHRRKTVGGFYKYYREMLSPPAQKLCEGKSNASGRFTCVYEPDMSDIDSGEFKILATAKDSKGRNSKTQTTLYLYGTDEVWFGQSDHDRMDVLSEKTSYKPGEKAVLQVRSPFREAQAWVNVMRSGVIIDTLVVPLSGNKPTIELPIKASYAPNVFINVLAVRPRVADPAPTAIVDLAKPAFKLGLVELEVTGDVGMNLKVGVTTDKTSYQSREKAVAAIQVANTSGKALPAGAEVAVFAIDEALLELLPNNSWDVLKTMLATQGYGFESASASMQVIGKRHFGLKAVPVGGGGGKSSARELFDTLLVWKGAVKLDAQGRAKIEIPINDSLTRFKVVAIASAGADQFGVGESSFTATKDLQVLSGLPATVREGERFIAGVTLRNTTDQSITVSFQANLNDKPIHSQSVTLLSQQTQAVNWPVDVPQDADELTWKLSAIAKNSKNNDVLIVKQKVTPVLLQSTYSILSQSLEDSAAPVTALVKPPVGSKPGKGEIVFSLSTNVASDPAGVRNFMKNYPFYCLEQRTSKAISLQDKALWEIISNSINQYITTTGLVTYYPNQRNNEYGYVTLTSYVLSASHEAGFKLPLEAQNKMLDALEAFVSGKMALPTYDYELVNAYSLTERKLLALGAIARYRKVAPSMADSLKLNPKLDLPKLSNRAVVEWLDVLSRSDWPQNAQATATALNELNSRLIDSPKDGSLRLKKTDADNRWYYMYSDNVTQVRLAMLAQRVKELSAQADKLAIGAVKMQRSGGYWWDTQANVWGSLLLSQRAAAKAPSVDGFTTLTLGSKSIKHDWKAQPQGGEERLSLSNLAGTTEAKSTQSTQPSLPMSVSLTHRGNGKPYVNVFGNAWLDLKQVQQSGGAELTRSMTPVRQQVKGQVTAGDIWQVQLKFKVKDNTGWVVVSDPIPSGATILGNGLKGQDEVVNKDSEKQGLMNADGSFEMWPAYVERTFTHIRAYYEYLSWWRIGSNEGYTLTYQVRINNPGLLMLPPSQLEAMYEPDVRVDLPNQPLVVK